MATTAAKERPIIFSAADVRATLDGHKTMTRRLVMATRDHSPMHRGPAKPASGSLIYHEGAAWDTEVFCSSQSGGKPIGVCPYGQPGDSLWVRETWSPDHARFYPNFPVVYRAEGYPAKWEVEGGRVFSPEGNAWCSFAWRSPIFMPRWASRLTLVVEAVRVERLREITSDDVYAEGLQNDPDDHRCLVERYAALWDSLHAKPGTRWDDSPWVWVVTFRKESPR